MSKFLIVDDERDILDILTFTIAQHFECEITTASDGLEAYEILQDHQFDLVITDQSMAEKSGSDLVKSMRAGECGHHESVPIIFVSSFLDTIREDLDSVLVDGVMFVDKPIDFERLINIVKLSINPSPGA